jgi:predicted nuclease of predicted toxin-antitoxin system
MKIYLDDNLDDLTLATLLLKAGHVVVRPADAGLVGATDTRHLTHAVRQGLVLLTADRDDFRDLHNLVLAVTGSHPGILVVRYDNDVKRDMRPKDIVTAVGKLERSGLVLANVLVILNQWR